ncbi:PCC domain-containing protein [Streptomyces sp. NPDC020412]|uniref:PCC domain-containing protein n=1 Tax=Streptomyces sp. NPDC020412 TaxID=3365073 RepID=UPI00379A1F5A
MLVFEVRDEELMESVNRQAAKAGVMDAAIVSLIGAADHFTISTMPEGDALKDDITKYELPAEMTGTGEIRNGFAHIHVVMAVEGDRAVSGHLHEARIGTHFARVYLIPCP